MTRTRSESGGGRDVARSASVIGLAVLSSRLLGLVREQVFAAFFGAGAVFDAYITAFRIPNLFRDLFAEGALSAAFVKTFSQTQERDGKARAFRLASLVFTTLGLVVAGFVTVGILTAPWLVTAIAPGFEPARQELAVLLTRVMFPFLWIISLAAVAMGLLNARGTFGVPALASAFFNAGSLLVGLATAFVFEQDFMIATARAVTGGGTAPADVAAAGNAIVGMAVGVLAGGCLQLLIQVPALCRTGYRYRPAVDLQDPGLRQVFALMGPAVIGSAATQVNVMVNTWYASHLVEGAVSWLNYAFRLMQFPLGVFGVAIATATLPAVARAAARGDGGDFRATLAGSLRLAAFLTLPSAAGLIVLGGPIVALIYERGSFAAADTLETAGALAGYAVGLVGYATVKILAPAFYALDDSRTPARVSVASILLNLVLCALLVGPLGHRGLALSTALVASANAVVLYWLLHVRAGPLDGRATAIALAKFALATAALVLAARGALGGLAALVPGHGTGSRLVVVLGAIAAGAGAYVATAALLRCDELRRLIPRRRPRR